MININAFLPLDVENAFEKHNFAVCSQKISLTCFYKNSLVNSLKHIFISFSHSFIKFVI